MKVLQSQMDVDGLPVTVHRKKMKTLRLVVLPPDGKVRVSAPRALSNKEIREFVARHRTWISGQQKDIALRPAPLTEQFVSGEQHSVWGERKTLEIVVSDNDHGVKLGYGGLIMSLPAGVDRDFRKKTLENYYRGELSRAVLPLIMCYQREMSVQVNEWRIRAMKTRWGSCNIQAKRIWVNLALAKYPPLCLEYLIVHELAHLLERYHNSRFWGIVEHHFPMWRHAKQILNTSDMNQAINITQGQR